MQTKILTFLVTGLLSTACIIVDEDDDGPYYYTPDLPPDPYVPADPVISVPIDPGETIEVEAGVGAGVFIEYDSGGTWHLFSACDTELSGASCEWDIVASIPRTSTLEYLGDEDLEADDLVVRVDEGALRLWTFTALDFDGFSFQAPSGEAVQFDVFLDGWPAPRFVSWVGGGGLQEGAPSNPVELVPTLP